MAKTYLYFYACQMRTVRGFRNVYGVKGWDTKIDENNVKDRLKLLEEYIRGENKEAEVLITSFNKI